MRGKSVPGGFTAALLAAFSLTAVFKGDSDKAAIMAVGALVICIMRAIELQRRGGNG